MVINFDVLEFSLPLGTMLRQKIKESFLSSTVILFINFAFKEHSRQVSV